MFSFIANERENLKSSDSKTPPDPNTDIIGNEKIITYSYFFFFMATAFIIVFTFPIPTNLQILITTIGSCFFFNLFYVFQFVYICLLMIKFQMWCKDKIKVGKITGTLSSLISQIPKLRKFLIFYVVIYIFASSGYVVCIIFLGSAKINGNGMKALIAITTFMNFLYLGVGLFPSDTFGNNMKIGVVTQKISNKKWIRFYRGFHFLAAVLGGIFNILTWGFYFELLDLEESNVFFYSKIVAIILISFLVAFQGVIYVTGKCSSQKEGIVWHWFFHLISVFLEMIIFQNFLNLEVILIYDCTSSKN